MIEREARAEAARIAERVARESSSDFEAAEFHVRSAMPRAGARVVEEMLNGLGRGRRGEALTCANKHLPRRVESVGVREKTIRAIMGEVAFRRSAYRCPRCGAARYPGDESLDVEGTGFSPGVRRLMAHAGSHQSGFRAAANALALYADLRLDAKDIERGAERTGEVVEAWMARERALARLSPPAEASPDTLHVSAPPARQYAERNRAACAAKGRTARRGRAR